MTAADLRRLAAEAERREAEEVLAEAARLVGLGVADLVGRDRRAETARARAVAAWVLVDRCGWTQAKAATHLQRTERQVRAMLRDLRRPGKS